MSTRRRASKRALRTRYDPARPWTVSTEYKSPTGRWLTPGTEVSIRGVRGRFRFQSYTRTEQGVEWIDVIGGPKGCPAWRSFRPDRIKRVHRDRRTLSTAEAVDLVRSKRAARKTV